MLYCIVLVFHQAVDSCGVVLLCVCVLVILYGSVDANYLCGSNVL